MFEILAVAVQLYPQPQLLPRRHAAAAHKLLEDAASNQIPLPESTWAMGLLCQVRTVSSKPPLTPAGHASRCHCTCCSSLLVTHCSPCPLPVPASVSGCTGTCTESGAGGSSCAQARVGNPEGCMSLMALAAAADVAPSPHIFNHLLAAFKRSHNVRAILSLWCWMHRCTFSSSCHLDSSVGGVRTRIAATAAADRCAGDMSRLLCIPDCL